MITFCACKYKHLSCIAAGLDDSCVIAQVQGFECTIYTWIRYWSAQQPGGDPWRPSSDDLTSAILLVCLMVLTLHAPQIYLQGLILGTLLNYLVKRNPTEEAHKEHIAQVTQFLTAKLVPDELRENVIAYFEFQYKKNMQNQAQRLIKLPRSLKIKVADANYSGLIEKCAQRGKPMQGCNGQFLHVRFTLFLIPLLILLAGVHDQTASCVLHAGRSDSAER